MQFKRRLTIFFLILIASIITSFSIVNGDTTKNRSISINSTHSLAFVTDDQGNKRVLSWGWNQFGQLGNKKISDSLSPVEITELTGKSIMSVAAGKQHSLGLTKTGKVYSWGTNNSGEIGNNSFLPSFNEPQEVLAYVKNNQTNQFELTALRNIIEIDAGDSHSVALKADGTVWTWGANQFDQLGQHAYISTGSKRVAEQVNELKNIVAVSSFRSHNLALDANGEVWAWGENWGGQMPTGLASAKSPYQVKGLPPIQAISTGSFHSLALDESGNVWTWGINDFDLREADNNYAIPFQLKDLPPITHIASGDAHNLVIDEDGNVWTWGQNSYGEVGVPTDTELVSKPRKVDKLSHIIEVAAGDGYSLAKSENGELYSWGRNLYGQLGDGTTQDRYTPTSIPVNFIKGIVLDRQSVELKPAEELKLNARPIPDNAMKPDLIWTSSNEDVVTVDENGVIKAVGNTATESEATVTVTTLSGGHSDSSVVKIKTPVTGIDITKSSLTLERVLTDAGLEDESYQLNAIVYPFNAKDKRIIWKSADPTIVSIDPTGKVTAQEEGKTTITATTIDGGWKDEITVYVTIPVKEIHIVGEKYTLELSENEEFQLEYYIYPMNATNLYVYNWKSSNSHVATVNANGKITAKNAGLTTITVTTLDKRKTGSIRIKVKDTPFVKLSGFNIPSTTHMKAKQTKIIEPTFYPNNATNQRIYWTSSDSERVEVNSNGQLTSHASGEATITARTADGNFSQKMKVKIGPNGNGFLVQKDKQNVSTYKAWQVSFNTPLDSTTVNEQNIFIKDGYNRNVPIDLTLSNDHKSITIKPVKILDRNTNFYLYITDNIKSQKGINNRNGTIMKFTTY